MTRYAFHLDASACSGCKACQIACKDRHGLPVGVLWRRVYEVTGGGWSQRGGAWLNDVFAYNVSMACNHCERPICLEVCPTAAIHRRPDGVVLIDPDRCMGCRYCEWACPYGALQYDAGAGRMTKCTFCVDDLDAGRKPACVAACPLRVLDVGDREALAARHGPLPTPYPLPDAAYTDPAFLVTPHRRTPGAAPGAVNGEAGGSLATQPVRDSDPPGPRVANREEVASGSPGLREPSLVAFTLLAQTAAGLSWALAAARWTGSVAVGGGARVGAAGAAAAGSHLAPLAAVGVLAIVALAVAFLHLGRPRNARWALANLRTSWLSREILSAALFAAVWAVLFVLEARGAGPPICDGLHVLVALAGVAMVYSMARVYRLRTVPSWDSGLTTAGFFLTAAVLGTLGFVWLAEIFAYFAPGGDSRALAVGVAGSALGVAALAAVRMRVRFYAVHSRVGV